ncbi:hypothetical protein BKA69DRAFT_1051991 [Paraphysoderma sedebokerense]|nr:hypothetical protein BKA69DRAFT_1051991 [Paraphysoderma sedebokerense]
MRPYFKVTLLRSTIGLPRATRKTVTALGLKKPHSVVYQPVNPSTAGSILKLKEILKVENMVFKNKDDLENYQKWEKRCRKKDPGFEVVGRECGVRL